jgi:Ca2+-binding RTX toxin-like protein
MTICSTAVIRTTICSVSAVTTGFRGNDGVFGGRGNDLIHGGGGNDDLAGEEGNDGIAGNDGNDELLGGRGRDFLIGGAGRDEMEGGLGSDKFVIRLGTGVDIIEDLQSNDRIDLRDFGFDSSEDVIAASRQLGHDAVIDLGNGDKLILEDSRVSHLDAAQFIVSSAATGPSSSQSPYVVNESSRAARSLDRGTCTARRRARSAGADWP